jgi:predicted TIM-barrel fold metal-dependent hydrolase
MASSMAPAAPVASCGGEPLMEARVPPLLEARASDEYAPLPRTRADEQALARYARHAADNAQRIGLPVADYRVDRRTTAASLRALNEAHGVAYFTVPDAAMFDSDAADDAFHTNEPVVDVQTHLVDPARWDGPAGAALGAFLRSVDPDRWAQPIDPHEIDAAAWASLVFGTSETAIALLTSTPGPAAANVLTNRQIAAARAVVDRYAGTGRLLTHAIVHPNLGASEIDAMSEIAATLHPSGWKCYTLYGPPTAASPTGGWFLDDHETGFPFLEQVRALGPSVVAAHKGLSGPVPDAALAAASPRDIGPAAAAYPDIDFVVYHSGYERDPVGQEGPYDATAARHGVDLLVQSVERAGIGPGGNVYAELGSTWFLMLRRPLEAAHVLGKLLAALGPERILWGTDSIWYGSPQPLIDAFRAFEIPEDIRERYGYPALDRAAKERILSRNARALYGIDDASAQGAAAGGPAWVANGAVELRRALARVD